MKKFCLSLIGLIVAVSLRAETLPPDPTNVLKVDDMQGPVESDPAIKNFQVKVLQQEVFYSFMEGRPNYTSELAAMIEVHEHKDLSKYGIVQYIRGCHFSTQMLEDGKVKYHIDLGRDHFGKAISFKHPEWVVDSTDVDPLYWNSEEAETGKDYGRTGLYRLDNPHESHYLKQYRFYYKHNKKHTRYYISDRPSGADESTDGKSFSNVSLEFKTCLFRHADVPRVSDPEGKAITAQPLKCYYWQSNFQYDFEAKRYQIKTEINPFCLN